MVADMKGDEELNAYKYNEEKTLSWLKRKTERVSEILKQKNIHVSGGAVSATFINTTKSESDNESYLLYAHGIVSEYLMNDLSAKLLKFLNLEETATLKRKSSAGGPEAKKPKVEEDNKSFTNYNSILDLSKQEKAKKPAQAAKDKARAKAAGGSKSITSFFKKAWII